ncbi:MAG: HD domain-containing protein [Bilifractor sp.]|jgi:uncharacterized protein
MSQHPSDNNPGPEQKDSSASAAGAGANPPDRIRRIMEDPRFLRELEQTEHLERDRIFCRHDWQHLLDTARIMQILCLRENLPVQSDLIYAAALLHDIGRARQYEDGTPHDIAGVQIAGPILADCGYTAAETDLILYAVGSHRLHAALTAGSDPVSDSGNAEYPEHIKNRFAQIMYAADKKSRPCYLCNARKDCNWPEERKNRTPEI